MLRLERFGGISDGFITTGPKEWCWSLLSKLTGSFGCRMSLNDFSIRCLICT